jgi:UDP:flavonoid glycosyltransferase YjiC (YdhE family)
MKITMIAPGSRGDVQPYVALGTGLKAVGHTVRVLTTQDFQTLVTSYGLEFVDMGGSVEPLAQQQFAGLSEQGSVLKILARTGRGARQLAHRAAVSGLAAGQDSDLLVGGLGGLVVGLALAEKLDIPFVQAYLLPFSPTREFPSILMPLPGTRLPRWANRLSHRATQQLMWQMFRGADAKARADILQLPPAPFWGPFASRYRQAEPILYGYSPHVVPRPEDWGDFTHVTGYWFLDPPAGWEAPAELVHFLQSGPPPIYVGFGSMFSSNPEATADLVVQALARSGQRGVIYGGWGSLQQAQASETVFMAGSLPHSWLFPHMAAVVHHGGVGTTAAALRAGVPSIVAPFFGDQPFWGQRVAALGVGPRPILRRHLTVDNLAEAIRCTVSDTEMRTRAAELGERIQAEDGIARAVAVIEQNSGRR